MCYTNRQIENRIKKLQGLQAQIDALQAEVDAIRDDLKADMGNDEERRTDHFILRYTTVTQSRINSAALKKELPDVYSKYCRESSYRRFSIN